MRKFFHLISLLQMLTLCYLTWWQFLPSWTSIDVLDMFISFWCFYYKTVLSTIWVNSFKILSYTRKNSNNCLPFLLLLVMKWLLPVHGIIIQEEKHQWNYRIFNVKGNQEIFILTPLFQNWITCNSKRWSDLLKSRKLGHSSKVA